MTSRLGAEIRANQGQAYSVWSRFGFDRVPGIFEMVASTESSQLESVVNSMRSILANMREEGVREDEVKDAKTAILRSLLFDYESRYAIAKDWARFESWGYPRNYLATFAKEIGKVDVDDVNRVLVEYFHPDQLSYMVVGPRWLSTQVQKNWPALQIVSESQLDGATEKTEE